MSNQVKLFGKANGEREEKPARSGRAWKTAVLVAALLVVLFGGAYAYAEYIYNGVFPHISVGGVPVGGLSRDETESKIHTELGNVYEGKSLQLMLDGKTYDVSAQEVGAAVDSSKAADEAWSYGRSGNMFKRVGTIASLLGSKKDIDAGFYIDPDALGKKAKDISDQASKSKKEYSYTVKDSGVTVTPGQTGLSYDPSDLSNQITERFKTQDYTILECAAQEEKPGAFDLDGLYNEVYVEPKDASLSVENGENTIKDHVVGVSFDKEQAESSLKSAEGKDVFIPFVYTQPKITKQQFEAALFRDVLTDTYTKLTNPGLVNRTHNVKLAVDFVNGTILLPGQVFSYNDVVGKRTVERGFRDAKVFVKGEIVDDIGGGICQVSSSLYMAALFSNLEIVQRTNHSFTVDYTKLGEDATVYYGSVDFQFKNNTSYPIKIQCVLDSPYVKVKILGTKADDTSVSIERAVTNPVPFKVTYKADPSIAVGAKKTDTVGHTGYTVQTYRIVKDAKGNVLSRKFEAKSVYKKLDEVILVNPADPVIAPAKIPAPSVQPTPPPETPPTEPSQEPSGEPADPTIDPGTNPSDEPTQQPTPDASEDDLYNHPI